jgi:superfamily II DNA or RNA helicase
MEKYKKYEIKDISQTMEDICFPKDNKFKLLPQQSFLADYLYDNKEVNGLLVYHEIGSGKTCTAINIAEKFKNEMKIIVVLPASLIGNFRNELRSFCPGEYIYMTKDEMLIKPNDKEYNEVIQKSDERINKFYNIYSYHIFIKEISKGLIDLENTLLIIDEIQNMVSISGTFYKNLLQQINVKVLLTKIILLSATPMFDTPMEIALTLNLLKPKILFPIGENFEGTFLTRFGNYYEPRNIDLFKKMATNLVSYYSGDLPISYPKRIFKTISCEMSEHQLTNYIFARKKENQVKKTFKASMNFPKTFLLGSRMVSNIAFPNGLSGNDGFQSLDKGLFNMKEYSTKFYKIFQNILQSDGPTFVYSTFLDIGGLKSFITYLEHEGYKNFEKHGIGEKRFAVYSGDESLDKREKIKSYYNQKENQSGNLIKILLGSPSTKEGISLYRVKQVHVMEPHWNLSRIKQIIGRAIRFCSHKDLPKDQRYVNVYLYLATHPTLKRSIDEYIWSLSKKKYKLIKTFENALKEVAIDCELFKKRNNIIKCDN